MSVEPVSEPRRDAGRIRTIPLFETLCSSCGGIALAYGDGSLWCIQCLAPLIEIGKQFKPSIQIAKRTANTAR